MSYTLPKYCTQQSSASEWAASSEALTNVTCHMNVIPLLPFSSSLDGRSCTGDSVGTTTGTATGFGVRVATGGGAGIVSKVGIVVCIGTVGRAVVAGGTRGCSDDDCEVVEGLSSEFSLV